jgi:hypothetical protein
MLVGKARAIATNASRVNVIFMVACIGGLGTECGVVARQVWLWFGQR